MRIVLISTPTRLESPNVVPPIGILALAAYMEQIGHEVRVIDAAHLRPTHFAIARQAAEFAPDLVGVGGIITSYSYIIGLTQVLRRELPGTPIVLGGPVVINNSKPCFEHMRLVARTSRAEVGLGPTQTSSLPEVGQVTSMAWPCR